MLAQDLLLPDEILEPLGPHAHGQGSRVGEPLVGCVREEVAHGTEVCCSPAELRHDGGRTEMAFEELKQRQSVVWGTGPYQNVTDTITDIHERVIKRLEPGPGVKWLDLACGTGAVAELAADAGAEVTGVDLAPGLIETAKERAQERGLDIDYQVGDCENLELEDGSFDVISSTCGVMFAPDHQATANELARVVKPGGRIGLANWTPAEKGLAALFRIMKPFQPPPPEGAWRCGTSTPTMAMAPRTFSATGPTFFSLPSTSIPAIPARAHHPSTTASIGP